MESFTDKIKKDFEEAVALVPTWTRRPTDEEFLKLYGLFKQSKLGDNNNPKPGIFDYRQYKKWDAWNEYKGLNSNAAMLQYRKFVYSIKNRYK